MAVLICAARIYQSKIKRAISRIFPLKSQMIHNTHQPPTTPTLFAVITYVIPSIVLLCFLFLTPSTAILFGPAGWWLGGTVNHLWLWLENPWDGHLAAQIKTAISRFFQSKSQVNHNTHQPATPNSKTLFACHRMSFQAWFLCVCFSCTIYSDGFGGLVTSG
jgi:hypothetical protein